MDSVMTSVGASLTILGATTLMDGIILITIMVGIILIHMDITTTLIPFMEIPITATITIPNIILGVQAEEALPRIRPTVTIPFIQGIPKTTQRLIDDLTLELTAPIIILPYHLEELNRKIKITAHELILQALDPRVRKILTALEIPILEAIIILQAKPRPEAKALPHPDHTHQAPIALEIQIPMMEAEEDLGAMEEDNQLCCSNKK